MPNSNTSARVVANFAASRDIDHENLPQLSLQLWVQTGTPEEAEVEITPEALAVFWRSVPESLAVALLKAAPKVAGPWTPYSLREDNSEEREYRCAGFGIYRQILGWFSKNIDRGTRGWFRYGFGPGGAVGEVETKEAARHICDEYNRASGWLLDNEK